MKYQIPEKRLLDLIDKYVTTTYPNAIKVEITPPGGDVSITSLLKNSDADNVAGEEDILIHKLVAFGRDYVNIDKEFLNMVKSMFGQTKDIKKVLIKWYNNKPTDNDLSGPSKQQQNEGEITERCWKGYTQKGMKTMFGKRYPNCVKVKKK